MAYVEILITAMAAVGMAFGFDLLLGRRGLFGALLVSGTGALGGAFLAIRVFALATMSDWTFVLWAVVGSALSLGAYALFRNKR